MCLFLKELIKICDVLPYVVAYNWEGEKNSHIRLLGHILLRNQVCENVELINQVLPFKAIQITTRRESITSGTKCK